MVRTKQHKKIILSCTFYSCNCLFIKSALVFGVKVKYPRYSKTEAELSFRPRRFSIAQIIDLINSLCIGKVDGKYVPAGFDLNTKSQRIIKYRVGTVLPEV